MRNLSAVALTIIVSISAVPATASAAKRPLSRQAAFALLKKSPHCVTRPPAGDLRLLLFVTIPDKGQDPAGRREASDATLAFLKFMVSKGLIRERGSSPIEVNDIRPFARGGGWTGAYPATQHLFEGVKQPDVDSIPESGMSHAQAVLHLQQLRCTGVTGIRQAGEMAEAQVAFASSLTPLGARLLDAAKDAPGTFSKVPDWISLTELLHKLPAPQTGAFRFTLWDDGWRLGY